MEKNDPGNGTCGYVIIIDSKCVLIMWKLSLVTRASCVPVVLSNTNWNYEKGLLRTLFKFLYNNIQNLIECLNPSAYDRSDVFFTSVSETDFFFSLSIFCHTMGTGVAGGGAQGGNGPPPPPHVDRRVKNNILKSVPKILRISAEWMGSGYACLQP